LWWASRSEGWALQQAVGGNYINVDDEDADEEGIEDLGSSSVPSVSKSRANLSDQNNSRLLRLCIDKSRAGNYVGGQMNGSGYKAIAEGFHAETRMMYDSRQLRNQIGQFKSTYSFWCFMQKHDGLGKKNLMEVLMEILIFGLPGHPYISAIC
jgi:hypothetical protein